jgi:nucleoside phosphorylase
MSSTAAAILSMKMIAAFKPRYLAMVGITAGIPGKTKMGDIIAADPSWDWGCGKFSIVKKKFIFMPSPHQLPLDIGIRNKLKQFALDKVSLLKIKDDWPADKPDHELSLLVGPLASGAAVLADGITVATVKQQHRDLLGIEMETYGVFAAAEEAMSPRPSVFSLKSVVDFADGKKSDLYQKYAAFASAQALRYFVENYL